MAVRRPFDLTIYAGVRADAISGLNPPSAPAKVESFGDVLRVTRQASLGR
jgi:hypothetical protein